ncbi:MAG: hypothetical protein SFY66_15470 [Oculatellaceae cyanobacterium bins.114]|nr:hypothetical protein [Oculatellaceae cyanobacterium bins.114]
MKNYCFAAIGMMAIALGLAPAATATDASSIGLDFSLAPGTSPETVESGSLTPLKPVNGVQAVEETQVTPLAIPMQAPAAPLGSESKPTDTAKLPPPPVVAAQASPSSVAAPESTVPQAPVPTPPTVTPQPVAVQPAPAQVSPQETVGRSPQSAPQPASRSANSDGILSFEQEQITPTAQATINPPASSGFSASLQAFSELDALFHGGNNSLVARAVGSAEGTRTPDGAKTRAYRGHVDPGNGVWNLGTFSYQHGAQSPEEADQRQLRRLRNQAMTLRQAAETKGLQLTLEEELNGIDLANQSPRAALSRGGYIDRLRQAHDMGLQGTDAVLWARTRSYLDPDSGRWNAPGLGNNVYSITNDQERRLRAIARAIAAKPQATASANSTPAPVNPRAALNVEPSQIEANADLILSLDLSP